jgi:hypothetical protein
MASERASQQALLGVSALLFAASAAVTIVWCGVYVGDGRDVDVWWLEPGKRCLWTLEITNPNVTVRGHDDPLMEFIYQEAVRGLLHQQNVVEGLNTRAGNLIFASAFATSLLGSRALSDGEVWPMILRRNEKEKLATIQPSRIRGLSILL